MMLGGVSAAAEGRVPPARTVPRSAALPPTRPIVRTTSGRERSLRVVSVPFLRMARPPIWIDADIRQADYAKGPSTLRVRRESRGLLDEAVADRLGHGLGLGVDLELFVDAPDVERDRGVLTLRMARPFL